MAGVPSGARQYPDQLRPLGGYVLNATLVAVIAVATL